MRGSMESRDRRPVRPSPGDRSWSHGPISRVNPRLSPERSDDDPTPDRPSSLAGRPPLPAVPPPRASAVGLGQPLPPGYGRRSPGYGRQPLPPYAGRPGVARATVPPRVGFGLPSLRRNVCPHFYMTGSRGAIPIQAPHLLKGLLRQPNNISRCQLRGGVHLDEGYVNDVCLTARFNQCVFYEDELTRE
jgi:hypothetical protein